MASRYNSDIYIYLYISVYLYLYNYIRSSTNLLLAKFSIQLRILVSISSSSLDFFCQLRVFQAVRNFHKIGNWTTAVDSGTIMYSSILILYLACDAFGSTVFVRCCYEHVVKRGQAGDRPLTTWPHFCCLVKMSRPVGRETHSRHETPSL